VGVDDADALDVVAQDELLRDRRAHRPCPDDDNLHGPAGRVKNAPEDTVKGREPVENESASTRQLVAGGRRRI
jgi:hypothetical protein